VHVRHIERVIEVHLFLIGNKFKMLVETKLSSLILGCQASAEIPPFISCADHQIDKGNATRADELNLHNRFLIPGPGIMGVACRCSIFLASSQSVDGIVVVKKREHHMGQFLATHPRLLRICIWATYAFLMYFISLFASWIVQGYGPGSGILIIIGASSAGYILERITAT
jgi:hypothetical protein